MRSLLLLVSLICFHCSYSHVQFLTISDIHYGAQNTPGDGHDSGPVVLHSVLKQLEKLSKRNDFMIYLGDLPTHSFFYDAHKSEYEKVVFHGLYQANASQIPMFYVTGNNDSLQGDYQAFLWKNVSPLKFATDWSGVCAYCEGLLIDDSRATEGGYYMSYVSPQNKEILLIALNSVQFSNPSMFFPNYRNKERDANIQLEWFAHMLRSHQAKQLLIAMHIPPGFNYRHTLMWKKSYVDRFMTLLKENEQRYGQITILSAHTHMEEIRRIPIERKSKNSSGVPSHYIYDFSTPAISRIYHNHSAMKEFELNQNLRMENFTTHYTTCHSEWVDEEYQLIHPVNGIFLKKTPSDLISFLDGIQEDEICNAISQGLFYGVKSARVSHLECNQYPTPLSVGFF